MLKPVQDKSSVQNTSIICTKQNDLKSEFASIVNVPGFVIAKDINSKYSVISKDYALLLGWKSPDHCVDLTDFDIPCEAVKAAEQFITLDQKVIDTTKAILSLYICNYSSGWKTLMSHKIPIQQEDGKITGIFGQVMDISNTNMFNWYLALNQFDKKFINSQDKPIIYILNQEHSPLPLSKKQQECVFLLLRGKSMKEIATILNLSVRTVESYFAIIKLKLGCSNKSQLIEKAINSGFLHYIPNSIIPVSTK
ncbi:MULTISPECIES: LuxR C-terminal-related transcriptional regulator [unclassified Candidatus Tisiphia]|uniref:LuxR C-terminal-related transcriptional regulator n=1 Tax=unclassified Candidatus Tisiphia TaxID=2996318 RepID=UPI00312C89B0